MPIRCCLPLGHPGRLIAFSSPGGGRQIQGVDSNANGCLRIQLRHWSTETPAILVPSHLQAAQMQIVTMTSDKTRY